MVGHSQGPGQVAVQFSGQLCDALLHLIRVGERNVMVWKVSHRSAVLRKSGAWTWLGPGFVLYLRQSQVLGGKERARYLGIPSLMGRCQQHLLSLCKGIELHRGFSAHDPIPAYLIMKQTLLHVHISATGWAQSHLSDVQISPPAR
jgi:hypothetical protein